MTMTNAYTGYNKSINSRHNFTSYGANYTDSQCNFNFAGGKHGLERVIVELCGRPYIL